MKLLWVAVMLVTMAEGDWHAVADLPLSLTVKEAARALGVGRTRMYESVKTGDVRSFKMGKAIRIPRGEIERLFRGGEAL